MTEVEDVIRHTQEPDLTGDEGRAAPHRTDNVSPVPPNLAAGHNLLLCMFKVDTISCREGNDPLAIVMRLRFELLQLDKDGHLHAKPDESHYEHHDGHCRQGDQVHNVSPLEGGLGAAAVQHRHGGGDVFPHHECSDYQCQERQKLGEDTKICFFPNIFCQRILE